MSDITSFYEELNFFNELSEEIKRNIKVLHVFKDLLSYINVILVTNESIVYCFGSNLNGVSGFGHERTVNAYTINDELSNKQIINFKSSGWHTVAHTSDGKLYSWGINEYLGKGVGNHEISKPELNESLINENIIDICCGCEHTVVLTSNKKVFAWGSNDKGQIGNRSDKKTVLTPYELKDEFDGEKVKAISCGSFHSMALTESGCVYSWGHNRWGQLGLNNDFINENKPQRIQVGIEIKEISCGQEHSLLLSNEGDIYVFGMNEVHQLGVIINKLKQLTPIKLDHWEKFIAIASHYRYNYSAALSQDGLYYIWGELGENINYEPEETGFRSFNEIFGYAITESRSIFQTGTYIKDWIELKKLGEGSFGKVFKVQDKFNEDQIFAIKKIPLLKGNSFIEDSYKEYSNSLVILEHDNEFLVPYHYVWIENDFQQIDGIRKYGNNCTIYIKMDFCDKTLSAFIKEVNDDSNLYSNDSLTQLGYYLLTELFIEILAGMSYLHDFDIIHRDLHLDNILLKMSSDGNCIQISDFGFAKIHDKNILNTGNIGDLSFSAPEILDGEYYDTRADIFSLGRILQKMFGIDVNSDHSNNGNQISLLMSKYENLRDLIFEMTNEDYENRPKCKKIIDIQDKWALYPFDFNYKEELNILLEICNENRSYVQNIIISKLSEGPSRIFRNPKEMKDEKGEINQISVSKDDKEYCSGINSQEVIGFDHENSMESYQSWRSYNESYPVISDEDVLDHIRFNQRFTGLKYSLENYNINSPINSESDIYENISSNQSSSCDDSLQSFFSESEVNVENDSASSSCDDSIQSFFYESESEVNVVNDSASSSLSKDCETEQINYEDLNFKTSGNIFTYNETNMEINSNPVENINIFENSIEDLRIEEFPVEEIDYLLELSRNHFPDLLANITDGGEPIEMFSAELGTLDDMKSIKKNTIAKNIGICTRNQDAVRKLDKVDRMSNDLADMRSTYSDESYWSHIDMLNENIYYFYDI